MIFSIIVPTFNNIKFLKHLIFSIKKNSKYNHQIILHINNGTDGTLAFAKNNQITFTYSEENIGLCSSINKAADLIKTNYILYAHDDMYFCKNWDVFLENEILRCKDNLYYLTGTNVSANNGLINFDCGNSPDNFDEKKFNYFCQNDKSSDLQGSHWAPHLVHRDLWIKIKGFSEDFNPGDGSDPDFCMKLWNNNVRIFKTISKFKVYHFSSITTRKSNIILNNGTKTFLLKYGYNPKFFRKYYLKGNGLNKYHGPLTNPKIDLFMYLDLVQNKIKFFYYKFLSFFK